MRTHTHTHVRMLAVPFVTSLTNPSLIFGLPSLIIPAPKFQSLILGLPSLILGMPSLIPALLAHGRGRGHELHNPEQRRVEHARDCEHAAHDRAQ